uniref:Amine oxidase domain-containing protein n=1 Tax=Plectus sambesii TaxID=2011161 RepID=A0A914XK65_9BILA
MKIVIIGAGPCGLGAAFRINELLNGELADKKEEIMVKVLEQEPFAGGLSRTVVDDKGFLWDMGGHITFHHNFPYYQNAVKMAIEEWNELKRNCQVDMNYLFNEEGIHLVPYPAQYAVPLFPPQVKKDCLIDLKERHENPPTDIPRNFEEWVQNNFGPTILESFFKPYTRKVWTVEPAEMNPGWVGSRVAKLDQQKLEELCEMDQEQLKHVDFGWGPNAVFTFPKYGGTGAVWKSMASKTPSDWYSFNSSVVKINPQDKKVVYMDKTNAEEPKECETDYDVLINTTPINLLGKYTGLCPDLDMTYNKVFVVGIGLKLPKPEWTDSFTWLYFPDSAVPFYRVTFFSTYGEVTPDSNQYWSVMCESARKVDDPVTQEEITEQSIQGLITKSIITKEQIVSVYSTTLPYGYPIPTINRDAELVKAHTVLEKNQIYSRGRFGGWKYEASNQDHCFVQGKELIDRLLLGQPECLYKTGLIDKQG